MTRVGFEPRPLNGHFGALSRVSVICVGNNVISFHFKIFLLHNGLQRRLAYWGLEEPDHFIHTNCTTTHRIQRRTYPGSLIDFQNPASSHINKMIIAFVELEILNVN